MIDIKIGTFQMEKSLSLVIGVSKDRNKLEGIVGERLQKIFDKMNWNTTFVIEDLTGVYFPQNDSYNGNIGLLERNLIDLYFAPNSYNILTRKIGLTRAVATEELMLMQLVDPPKIKGGSDVMNIKMTADYWLFYAIAFSVTALLFIFIIFKSYLFIFKFLNKKFNCKILVDILLSANFFCASLFIEQIKSNEQLNSLLKFPILFIYIGIWLWNKLFSCLIQTEAFKIDLSMIINSFDQTLTSSYQACLLINEPLSYEFIDKKRQIFSSMFPTKPRHLYKPQINDILDFMHFHQTRVFIATSIFIKSLSWSLCSQLRSQMGDRKIFIPTFLIDESIGVYYYNLKSDENISNAINKRFSVSMIEQSLISYQRNPSKINLLNTDVQNFCVVRNLKVLEEATHSSDNQTQNLNLETYYRFLLTYFMMISSILAITLINSFIRWLAKKGNKKREDSINKLGNPLVIEKILDEENLNKFVLNSLYVNFKTMTKIIESKEFYLHLNPFYISIIDKQYQLMKLKYKRIFNKIRTKIPEHDYYKKSGKYLNTYQNFALMNDNFCNSIQNYNQLNCESKFQIYHTFFDKKIIKFHKGQNYNLYNNFDLIAYDFRDNNKMINYKLR